MANQDDYKEVVQAMEADSFHKGCELSVLVEDFNDERFWQFIIEHVKPELKDKIDFIPPCSKGTRGKDILKMYKDFIKNNFVICVDSDCEYLYDPDIWYTNDYVYHTVVYSKENFQCCYLSLNEICKDLTTTSYDFAGLFENISRKISPLFYVWLIIKENNWHQLSRFINNETFNDVLDFTDSRFDGIGDETILYRSIEQKVGNKLRILKNEMGEEWYDSMFEFEIPEIKARVLKQYSIHEKEILLFCHGHSVFDFFCAFMAKLIAILKDSKIDEVKKRLANASGDVVDNTIRRIEKIAQQDLKSKFHDSFKFLVYGSDNSQMKLIKEKLANELG